MKTLFNKKGFSLVELMVVVAIIGILAAIAVPNVNKFMVKSRQSEAKTNLAALYTSEKAFYTEYTTYSTALPRVGFAPEGTLRYNVGFGGATFDSAAPVSGGTEKTTDDLCKSGGPLNGSCSNFGGYTMPTLGGGTATVSTFTALAGSSKQLLGGGTSTSLDDSWSIDNNKSISQAASAL